MRVTRSRPSRADTDAGPVAVPAARAAAPADTPDVAPASRGFLARAALITAVLTAAGALLGLVRDQALARLFGAG
ncbi:MAG: murein biosynthesis protein MurJ, partial [Streptomyces sp.]|nr:murein biosynthesis protein MurJ [Streptomyces sp.]